MFQIPHRSVSPEYSASSYTQVRRSARRTYCPEMPSGFQVPEDSGSAPPRMPHPVRIPVPREPHREYSPYAVPGNTYSRIPGMKISFLPLRQHRKRLPPLIFSYLSVSCFIPHDRSFLRTVTHSSFENFPQPQSFPVQPHF